MNQELGFIHPSAKPDLALDGFRRLSNVTELQPPSSGCSESPRRADDAMARWWVVGVVGATLRLDLSYTCFYVVVKSVQGSAVVLQLRTSPHHPVMPGVCSVTGVWTIPKRRVCIPERWSPCTSRTEYIQGIWLEASRWKRYHRIWFN